MCVGGEEDEFTRFSGRLHLLEIFKLVEKRENRLRENYLKYEIYSSRLKEE